MNTVSLVVTLLKVLLHFVQALEFCIFLAVIFSWFPGSARHPVVRFIRSVAEPILQIARKLVPRIGMIDFSPILAFIVLTIIEQVLNAFIQSISI